MYTYDDVKEHSNDREYVEKAIEEDGLLLDAKHLLNCKTTKN